LDKALAIKHKRVQLGDLKRKAISQGQGSSSVRPRYVSPQGTPTRPGGGPRPAQYAPHTSKNVIISDDFLVTLVTSVTD
jgi:hypothetical protein